jgi:hypothetical protein
MDKNAWRFIFIPPMDEWNQSLGFKIPEKNKKLLQLNYEAFLFLYILLKYIIGKIFDKYEFLI